MVYDITLLHSEWTKFFQNYGCKFNSSIKMTFGKEEIKDNMVAQWLSGRVPDSRGRRFEPH